MQKVNNSEALSDALVLFGVTGDLAYKKIFPALYALVKQNVLNVPVIGVASTPWSITQLRRRVTEANDRAKDRLEGAAMSPSCFLAGPDEGCEPGFVRGHLFPPRLLPPQPRELPVRAVEQVLQLLQG